ncbi:MAG: hypothetical protein CVT84_05315 [Alphaproteobacteria bacterium HGW-Alphaproteobacteria-6]|nr:MAG: hypothetical protein CVT84_05315 [Alphaproteobacteria bacterium HGW-Alphaproteobacteria-6]
MDSDPARDGDASLLISTLRNLARLALLLVAAWGIHLLVEWTMFRTASLEGGMTPVRLGVIVALLLAYAVLIAIPFVPGVELGISLMVIEGWQIAPFVYLATVIGLTLAYCAGQKMPYATLRRILTDMRLNRAAELMARLEPLSGAERLALLRRRLPARLAPFALKQRYVLLALLINLPGNMVIGGGGGIALIAGLSRLFGFWPMMLTFALAVAPVPVLVYVFGFKLPALPI